MSEHEGGESRTAVAFFLGFLLGVLVSLGGAGTYFLVYLRHARAEAEAARLAAEAARAEAELERMRAEQKLYAAQAEKMRKFMGEGEKDRKKAGK